MALSAVSAFFMITYANKDKDAALGTLERSWTAEDANEVKAVVNNLVAILAGLELSVGQTVIATLTEETSTAIEHRYGRKAVVTCIDTDGALCHAGIEHVDDDNVILEFNPPFTGKAILT